MARSIPQAMAGWAWQGRAGSTFFKKKGPENEDLATTREPAMNVSLKFLARLALLGAVLAGSAPAMAHRSGCHRWHSCPSDTGSYVCGDTGHSSECPRTEPEASSRKKLHEPRAKPKPAPAHARPASLPSRPALPAF